MLGKRKGLPLRRGSEMLFYRHCGRVLFLRLGSSTFRWVVPVKCKN